MALSPEDKKDVKGALGKAMANKISKVTNDSKMKAKYGGHGKGHFTANGGWRGNNMGGVSQAKDHSGFGGRDNS